MLFTYLRSMPPTPIVHRCVSFRAGEGGESIPLKVDLLDLFIYFLIYLFFHFPPFLRLTNAHLR